MDFTIPCCLSRATVSATLCMLRKTSDTRLRPNKDTLFPMLHLCVSVCARTHVCNLKRHTNRSVQCYKSNDSTNMILLFHFSLSLVGVTEVISDSRTWSVQREIHFYNAGICWLNLWNIISTYHELTSRLSQYTVVCAVGNNLITLTIQDKNISFCYAYLRNWKSWEIGIINVNKLVSGYKF